MTIHQLARKTGRSKHTIRYWERVGLLRPRRSRNGYRHYNASDHQRVVLIELAKQSGFRLKELPVLLDRAMRRDLTFKDIEGFLLAQRERLDRTITELTATRTRITDMLENCMTKGVLVDAVFAAVRPSDAARMGLSPRSDDLSRTSAIGAGAAGRADGTD